MKRKFIATACMSLLGLSAAVPAFADNEDDTASTCSIATMLGTYVWAYAATNAGGPYSTSGRESYDGHGNFKWFQLFNSGGTATFTYSGTGTYTMTADCVASVVYADFTPTRLTLTLSLPAVAVIIGTTTSPTGQWRGDMLSVLQRPYSSTSEPGRDNAVPAA